MKSRVTCIVRALESGPAEEGLRQVPDLHKDDLAQRRIQGRLGPQREAPSFVTVANITEADRETWERLKVSGKTRCVMFSPGFLLTAVSFNFEGITYPSIIFYFHGQKKCLKTQSIFCMS